MTEHGMRPRMPSVEDLDEEIKTFSGELDGMKSSLTIAEKRFIDFLNNYESRVARIEGMAQRAETLSAQTSISSQEAIARVNQQLQSNVSMLMDITRVVREIQESKTKVWRDFAAAITPILVVIVGILHVMMGGGK